MANHWWGRRSAGLMATAVVAIAVSACDGSRDAEPPSAGLWEGPVETLAPEFQLGSDAPDILLNPLPTDSAVAPSGPEMRLSELRGAVVLLDFWGAWCSGCIREHTMLVDLADRYRDRGVLTFGVTEDSPEEVARFAARHGRFSYPLVSDDGSIARRYQIIGWPTKVIIDRHGKTMWWRPGGPLPRETIMDALEAVLADKRPESGPRAGFEAEPRPESWR